MTLLEEVIEAHGGAARWAGTATIRGRVRSGGLLLRTRVPGGALAATMFAVDVGRVRAVADPYPCVGQRGIFEDGAVRIESSAGEVIASRAAPRTAFFGHQGLRRNLRWDTLDAIYFAGYAWWNYLNAPYLLIREGVEVAEAEPAAWAEPAWRRLDVVFPAGLDTHSRQQSFHYDEALRLRRHDYVAEVVGRWARAAHMCADHVEVGGLVIPTRRWVRPVAPGGRALPFPTLVALELSAVEVESASGFAT